MNLLFVRTTVISKLNDIAIETVAPFRRIVSVIKFIVLNNIVV